MQTWLLQCDAYSREHGPFRLTLTFFLSHLLARLSSHLCLYVTPSDPHTGRFFFREQSILQLKLLKARNKFWSANQKIKTNCRLIVKHWYMYNCNWEEFLRFIVLNWTTSFTNLKIINTFSRYQYMYFMLKISRAVVYIISYC